MIQESLRLFVRSPPKPLVVGGPVLCAKFRNEIRHSRAAYRAFELVRLCNRPLAHVSAVGPARNSETVGIGNSAIHKIVYARHHVLEISAAPVAAVHLNKFLPV